MKAQINARLGHIFYKCVFKGNERLRMLKKAKTFYSAMKQAMGTMQSYGDDDYQVIEKWFLDARQEDMELRAEITELDVPSLTEQEKIALSEAKPVILEANNRFKQDTSTQKRGFMGWLNDYFVPEEHRQPIPE